VKGSTPRIETQVTSFAAAEPVADATAHDRAGRDSGKEHELVDLRRLCGLAELIHQIEDVVAREARQVDVFGEQERDQDGHSL
jgi:hypothetical protein